jgi:hypothetical protein
MQQVVDRLKKLGMSEYAQCFADNNIDFSVLRHLTDRDLKELGLSLGHRRKMLAAIAELGGTPRATPQSPVERESYAQGAAERRQLRNRLDQCKPGPDRALRIMLMRLPRMSARLCRSALGSPPASLSSAT